MMSARREGDAAPSPPAPPGGMAGKSLSSQFLIGEELGRGAFGQVRARALACTARTHARMHA